MATSPSPAAIGPTPRQLGLQAEARAKGGLTQSGIARFNRLSSGQQREAVEQQEKRVGLRTETTYEQQQRVLNILKNRGTFTSKADEFQALN